MQRSRSLIMLLSILLTVGLLIGCGSFGQAELLTPAEYSITDAQEDGTDKHTVKGEIMGQGTEEEDKVLVEPSVQEASLWDFSYRLLKENIGENNPVLSPVSAYLAMGMTGLGAAGDTLAEFEQVMGYDMHEVSRNLMQALPAEPGTLPDGSGRESKLHVSLANSIWVDTQMEPLQSWLEDVSDIYNAKAYRAELSTTGTMNQMNEWIEEETKGLIKKFLAKPLDPETRLALFNTVYFYGEWQSKFEENNTYKDTFTKEDGTELQVEMMHEGSCNRRYVQQEDFDGVVLPYRDGNMALVALKPTAGQSVRDMYEALTEEQFSEILAEEDTTLINLKLPKFEVTFDKSLNETLQNVGIEKAFDGYLADFSNMGTSKSGNGLYISLVRQKAVVKVDEEGTEAAAVTMVAMKESAMAEPVKPTVDVYFDEPFLYMIVDTKEEVPLFMGIMDDPESE